MRNRAHDMIAFSSLLVVAFGGMLQFTPWIACVGACVLALESILERGFAGGRYRDLHRGISQSVLTFSSVLNASAASAAAFGLGRLSAFVWGI